MIRLNALKKTYNKAGRNPVTAVNAVSLMLPQTGMVAIFGRSGCGKTTLLNLIGGLDRADYGEVNIDGATISPSENDARNRNIGFIFQNYYLAPTLTVEENVAASLRLCGLTDEAEIAARVKVALTAVGLEKFGRRLPQNLSGGQQQRVAIARAIVKNPNIILADEPTGNLDEANTVMIMDLLKEISKTTLVVLVTHELHLVNFYCDRVIEMLDGRVIGEFINNNVGQYNAQSRNEVYLGDMQKSEECGEAVSVNMYSYGQAEKLSISIINVGGVYYIRNDDPNVKLKMLDSGAELKVHEGTYEENVAKKNEQKIARLSEVTSLPRITDGKTGRMYKVMSGVKSALRKHFAKKKKLRAVLVATMFTMSIVFVSMMANSFSFINIIDTVKANFDGNLIYIPQSAVSAENIEDIRAQSNLFYPSVEFSETQRACYVNFRGGYSSSSMTYHSLRSSMYKDANILPSYISADAKLLCGKGEVESRGEIVVSSAFADSLLEQSTLSFVKEYEDLLGLSLAFDDILYKGYEMRIVGVVENTQSEIYVDVLIFSNCINLNGAVGPKSLAGMEMEIEKGKAYVASFLAEKFSIGSKVVFNGISYEVAGYFESGNNDIYYEEDYYEKEGMIEYYSEGRSKSESITVAPSYNGQVAVIISDEDFKEAVLQTGESSYEQGSSYLRADYYAIYPKNVDAMEDYLGEMGLSRREIVTADDMFDYYYNYLDVEAAVVGYVMSMIIVSAFIAICMFFIMRSSITSDVKEIGIYRAIGVSRKNIIFKYFVESNVIFFLTVFIGYALSAGVIMWANASSSMTHSLIYMPWYMAIAVAAYLYLISIVCGILPVILLTAKSPAAIISKYDI